MTAVLIGIDVGTSSTKGVVVTTTGAVVATASRAHRMSMPFPGWAEMDPVGTWWTDVVTVSRGLMAQVIDVDVLGVCVSGMGPCLVLTDSAGDAVRPAILYGIDCRAGRQIETLTERLGVGEVADRCGNSLSTQAVGPKLLWVREEEPAAWSRSRRWHGLSSFVVGRLTGEYVIDHQSASQCDPLYDVRHFDWNHDWVDEVAPGLEMPRLVWPEEVVGVVSEDAARETGIPAGTPVSAGTVDAWAEAFSAGVRGRDDLMVMYGSTMFFVRPLDAYVAHPRLWTTVGVEPGSHTLAAGTATSGSLVRWVEDLTGEPLATLEQAASAIPPGSDGLVFLPYFAGERSPVQDPLASGLAIGLTLRHHRGHLLRAAYEGIALGIAQILEVFDEVPCGDPTMLPRLVAVGGGTGSRLLTQIVSDVTGRPQVVPEETIGASYGSALLAAIGTGSVARETNWARPGRMVEPDPSAQEAYGALTPVFAELYADNAAHMHRLAGLSGREAATRGRGPLTPSDCG